MRRFSRQGSLSRWEVEAGWWASVRGVARWRRATVQRTQVPPPAATRRLPPRSPYRGNATGRSRRCSTNRRHAQAQARVRAWVWPSPRRGKPTPALRPTSHVSRRASTPPQTRSPPRSTRGWRTTAIAGAAGRFARPHSTPRQTRLNTSVALVPPKPKLFDMTVFSCASRISRRIGKPSARGSSVSMFAEAAMKPPCSISRL